MRKGHRRWLPFQGERMNRNFRIAAQPALGSLLLLAMCTSAVAGDSPARLRSEISTAEKQYIEQYNKLNTDPQFEILCINDKPTGSNFATRVCRARYLMDAMRASGSEQLQNAVTSGGTSSSASAAGPAIGNTPAGNGLPVQPEKDEAFRQNVLEIQRNSPQLRALVAKREELQKRLEAASSNKGSNK
jgi:hypothetical protein